MNILRLVLVGTILVTISAQASDYRYEQPEINDTEKEALKYMREGAFEPSGQSCAWGLTLAHPTTVDKDDVKKLTIPTTMLRAMVVQNGRRCICIGNRSVEVAEEMPESYRTRDNIKTFLYNVMSYMGLKHHRYYPWGGKVEGFDETTQRYHVEAVANYCEIPVDGLSITTF